MPDTKNVPIRWGKYIDHDMEDKKVMFIGAEKAIYGSDGRRLDEKLVDMEGSLSDAFSETKDYAVGEYCVYTNRVFKFTKAKTAGEWDGTAVIPVSLAQEISEVSRGIAALNSHFNIGSIVGQSYYTGSDGADANKINRYFVLCKGANLPDSNSFWFLQTIIFQIGADGFVERGKQIAYKYDGSQIYERHKAYDQTWTAWNGYATKSDLSDYVKLAYFDNTIAIDANGAGIISIPYSAPSGYKFIGIVNAHAEGFEIVTFNSYLSGSNITVNIRNVTNQKVTKRIIATVLFVKS